MSVASAAALEKMVAVLSECAGRCRQMVYNDTGGEEQMRGLDEVQLDPELRRVLDVAAQRLRGEFDIAELVLFGSVARGEATEDSDVDLLVVLKSEATHTERNAVFSAIFRINLELGSEITALVVSEEDWKHGLMSISPIRQEVERDGAWLA